MRVRYAGDARGAVARRTLSVIAWLRRFQGPRRAFVATLLGLAVVGAQSARAGWMESNRTLNAGGGWCSNGTFRSATSIGTSCPVGSIGNSSHIAHGGFLRTFLMHPDRDFDGDKIPDEDDPDNDGDGLADVSELNGSAFKPTTPTDPLDPDTDDDGVRDGDEAADGTDPLDLESRLWAITHIIVDSGEVTVTWDGRDGRTYELLCATNAEGLATNGVVVSRVTATGGTGSWYETESSDTNTLVSGKAFYRVRVLGQ